MVGNTTVDPLAWASAVTRPEIDAVRNPRTGHVLNVRRMIRAFRYERAILLRQRLKALVKGDGIEQRAGEPLFQGRQAFVDVDTGRRAVADRDDANADRVGGSHRGTHSAGVICALTSWKISR